ncbi:HD-GYP domain-containing protein [Rubrobacter aplysinae]|uniref:HD-GYP domain-containing protein n=1 Tax=Rubrobacter aplysinae TaxID=909625 RepID=UPI00128AF565|nr:HD-GYP domain-containing protein [Rubrobacter aplysinae]
MVQRLETGGDRNGQNGRTAQASRPSALAVASDLARRVAAEPENLGDGLADTARSLTQALDLDALVIEARVGGEEIRVSSGEETRQARPPEVPILRDKVRVGRMLFYTDRESAEPGVREELLPVADVLSLAVSTAEAHSTAARRSAQASVVQLASEALSRTLDEEEIYRAVLTLTIELLDSRAGAVLDGDGEPVASAGFEDFPEALDELVGLGPPGRRGWQGRIEGGCAAGVPFGGQNQQAGSVLLFREEKGYEESEVASLRLVARQLSHAQERSRLHAALEHRDLEAILALSAALESRDGTTGEHIGRTQSLAETVALDLGLGPSEARTARYAAVLHDIGKIGIPDFILNKPGALSEKEWAVMRRHPVIGADILASIAGFESISEAVLSHHERFDGGGYPRGNAGEDTPVEARIISVVDAYDAMTNDRPYREAMSHETALEELERNAGTQFDPRVIDSMKRVIRR